MKKIILSIAILGTFLTACKKKDDPAPAAPTKTTSEYLTAHEWKTTGAVSNVNIDADDDVNTPDTKDMWSSFEACAKDDILTFAANGVGTYTDAGTSCGNPGSAFTWTLSGNSLTITIGANSEVMTIGSVDDNTLKLSLPANTDPNNVSYIETDIFSK